ncbi:hypothetical protein A4A49_55307 [Nicotiana attenuata]|uniref:Uncharacterized protein n=1 Tax=Nicotiana attenuata TaxID=49451 RepID=A0A314LFN3_NICAT|nr:hypothetical protein A4A49_55307 [Nicotiana attenuata]
MIFGQGEKCAYWEWEDNELPPRVIELICNLKKEKDWLKRERNALQRKVIDLEKYVVVGGTEMLKENDVLKKKVADLENLLVHDVRVNQKLKNKVFKQWIVICILCCFVGIIASWKME